MADNSIRERIILADMELIEAISSIKTVIRTVPTLTDLDNYAVTQLPLACVVGKLPVPKNHISKRDGQVDQIISDLAIDIFVFFQENVNMDSELSFMLDDFWAAMYSNPTRSNLVMTTWLEANPQPEHLPPYYAFQLIVNHSYKHTTGGI